MCNEFVFQIQLTVSDFLFFITIRNAFLFGDSNSSISVSN